jgi:hypothetical protein
VKEAVTRLADLSHLMALDLMALLGFLAKVSLWLIDPEAFVDDAGREQVKAAKDRLIAALPDEKKLVKEKWPLPRPGDCNEERAFVKFVDAMRGEITLGIADSYTSDRGMAEEAI